MLRAIILWENEKEKQKLEGSIQTKFKSKNKFEFSLRKIGKKEENSCIPYGLLYKWNANQDTFYFVNKQK